MALMCRKSRQTWSLHNPGLLWPMYYCTDAANVLQRRIPPPLRRSHDTRQAVYSHRCSVQLSNPRINKYSQSFIHRTSNLWNDLPPHAFPPTCNLQTFKSSVSRHLYRPLWIVTGIVYIYFSFSICGKRHVCEHRCALGLSPEHIKKKKLAGHP